MSSPVDPSRRTALADDLERLEMCGLAAEINSGSVSYLDVVVARVIKVGTVEREWWWRHGKPLVRAIEAGEYGPYQETGER